VTGTSYGGIQAFLLATLRNKVMQPDGELIPWRSPGGRSMEIAAAVPRWGWTMFPEALVPAGNDLDYLTRNPYGPRIGVPELSYFNFLYPLGLAAGYYAPPGADFESDITAYYLRALEGEPYDGEEEMEAIIETAKRFHSSYYLEPELRRAGRGRPAPMFAYNSWTDDLNPADEAIRYFNQVRTRYPGVELSALFANGAGHPRAGLTATTPEYDDLRARFFDRYLKGGRSERRRRKWIGIHTFTQACNDASAEGPFVTRRWRRQHPGEVRGRAREEQTFNGTGGDPATSAAIDPFAGTATNGCATTPAIDQANAATIELPEPEGDGYTMVGAPTVVARIETGDANSQVQARLFDIAPNGSQTLVTRGSYRPRLDRTKPQVFQLNPNAWHFAEGHVPKLELLGADTPYARPSNGSFSVTVADAQVRLPVREPRSASAHVKRPRPPLGRNGKRARRGALAGW
jgi:hypothetical protein